MQGKTNMFVLPRFDEPVNQRRCYGKPHRFNALWKNTEYLRKLVVRGVITQEQYDQIIAD